MNVSEKDKIIGQNINNLLKEHKNVSKAVQDQKNETYKNLHQKAYSRDILSNVNNQINNFNQLNYTVNNNNNYNNMYNNYQTDIINQSGISNIQNYSAMTPNNNFNLNYSLVSNNKFNNILNNKFNPSNKLITDFKNILQQTQKITNNYNINNINNNWFSSMEQIFNNLGDQIYNTFKDYQIDEKIQKANEYINDKTEQITNSELFQNMKNKAENGIQIIKAKASELYNINGQYNDLDNKKSSDIVEMSDIELQNEKNNNNNNEISNKENKNIINNNEENTINNEKENILNDDKKNILSNDKEHNINNEK